MPLHATARAGLEQYIERRRPYAPFDDHLFISLHRKPLQPKDVVRAFNIAVKAMQACPDGRDHITQHRVALSTVLGHACVEKPYWYLEATAELMTDIAERSERFFTAGSA